MTTQYLERPTGRIAYDIAGDGPLIICQPSMGELRSSFRHIAPALIAAGYTVATMDLRGHGESDITFDSYDDEAAATDQIALIEHLGKGPALIVGNSMAAAAGVIAAAERPEVVAGLALLGAFVRNPPVNPVMALTLRVLMGGPWAKAVWLAYLPAFYPGDKPADFDEHKARIKAWLDLPGRRRAFTATTHTSHAPAEARLDRVSAPTLVIMGSKDPDFPDPAAEAAWIAERLNGTAVVLDGIGHYPQNQSPEATLDALLPFAATVHSRA